uniref:UDP-glucuronosyltransferase n=1 Tax=Lutzomyia longipalpis TaxID=7200 RepID=A0A1B0CI95_LUTLO
MKKPLIVVFFVYLWCLHTAYASGVQWRGNILCLMGVPSPSHHIWNRSLMQELMQRGYNLTVLTVEIEESQPNLHFITMENVYEDVQLEWNAGRNGDGVDLKIKNPWSIVVESYDFYHFVSQKLTSTQGFQQLLDYPDNFKFSAIIHDFSLGQVMLGFVKKFNNPPLISVSPFGAPPNTWTVAGESLLAPFSPHFSTGFPAEMNFWEKMANLGVHLWDWVYRKVIFMPRETHLARRYFPGVNLEVIEQESRVILINREPLLDAGIPLPAHVVNVGGLHVDREGWLPHEIERVLSSPRPTFLFALGSNMRSDLLGEEILSKFIKVFQKLSNFTFIWKYEGRRPSNWPRNIITIDWLDQNKVLEHPNLALFITHGGLLSVQEAAWYGVPILGIPLFMDQHTNIAKAVSRGLGLDFKYLTPLQFDELERKILQIVEKKHSGRLLEIYQKHGNYRDHHAQKHSHGLKLLLSMTS